MPRQTEIRMSKNNFKYTKSSMKYLIILSLFFLSCQKENNNPLGFSAPRQAPHPLNWHHGNAMQNQDSASAYANSYLFPPLFSDSISYHQLVYNTGFTYDTVTSSYTITQSGNYTIEATCYRNVGDTADLQLSVNGITVYSTGLVGDYPTGFITNQHLMNGDVLYIRTSTYQGVDIGGVFTIKR